MSNKALSLSNVSKGMSRCREVTYNWEFGFWFTMSQQFVCPQVVFKTPAVKHRILLHVTSVVYFQCHVHENAQYSVTTEVFILNYLHNYCFDWSLTVSCWTMDWWCSQIAPWSTFPTTPVFSKQHQTDAMSWSWVKWRLWYIGLVPAGRQSYLPRSLTASSNRFSSMAFWTSWV